MVSAQKTAPPYGQRKGWIPRVVDDFGDGGAYPEVHVAQYPMNLGRPEHEKSSGNKATTLAVQLDASGKVKYDLLARQGHGKDKVPMIFISYKNVWLISFSSSLFPFRLYTASTQTCFQKKSQTRKRFKSQMRMQSEKLLKKQELPWKN